MAAIPKRNEKGQLLPGQVLNPGGRPSAPAEVKEEIRTIFEAASAKAAKKLVELIDDPDARIAASAAIHVLDRLLGKVTQSIDATVKTGSIQQAHLAALTELRRRRVEERAAEVGATVEEATVIDITPVESK